MLALSAQKIQLAAEMLKLLGNPVRLSIVELLEREQELSVSAVVEKLGQPQPTVSQYLNQLRRHGLLAARRAHGQVLYSLAEPQLSRLLDCIRNCKLF